MACRTIELRNACALAKQAHCMKSDAATGAAVRPDQNYGGCTLPKSGAVGWPDLDRPTIKALRDRKAANHCYNQRTENDDTKDNTSKLDDTKHLLHEMMWRLRGCNHLPISLGRRRVKIEKVDSPRVFRPIRGMAVLGSWSESPEKFTVAICHIACK